MREDSASSSMPRRHTVAIAPETPVAYRRWDSAVIPDLFFFDTTEHDLTYADHLHESLEILWVRSGCFELEHRGNRYLLHRGDAVLIAPDEIHAAGPHRGELFRFASLHVPRGFLDHCIGPNHVMGKPHVPLQFVSGKLAEHLYQALLRGLPVARSAEDQKTCLQDALRSLSGHSLFSTRIAAPASYFHPAVRSARTLIQKQYVETVDLSAIATEFGLHRRYLITLFKEAMGLPPHQYQIAKRIDFARCLLDDTLSLSAVASTAGFSDQSHFYRYFKRTYCMTPRAYRIHTVPFEEAR